MNNIKIFETEEQYLASEKLYPQVSHCLDTDRVYVEGEPVFNEITIKVKGANKSSVKLINPNSDSYKVQQVTTMYIDDVKQSSVTDSFIFNDEAIHTVKFGYIAEVTSLKEAFVGSKMTEIDFTNFDFTPTKDISYIFGNINTINNTLTSIIWGDKKKLEGASFTNVKGLYCGCSKMTNFDYSVINKAVSNDFSYMFYNCSSLKVMLDFPWNNKPLICISMFQKCSSLEDVSMFTIGNSNNNNNYANMFNGVKSSGENPKYNISEKGYNGYGQLQIPSWYGNILYFGTNIFLAIMGGPKHGDKNNYGWKMYK